MSETSFERRLYGHRGASLCLPENTLAAFERALADGATAIETDVHLTADGHVVISHDASGERRAGIRKAIAECSYEDVCSWAVGRTEAGEELRVPSLDEALERFPDTRFNIDIKPNSEAAALKVMELIESHHAAHRVTLASFHDAVLATVKAHHYPGEISLSLREVLQVTFAPRMVTRLLRPRGTAIQIPTHAKMIRLDTRDFVMRCHSLGLRVDYWVINDPNEARRLLDLGADGIVTDDPASIAPVMRKAG